MGVRTSVASPSKQSRHHRPTIAMQCHLLVAYDDWTLTVYCIQGVSLLEPYINQQLCEFSRDGTRPSVPPRLGLYMLIRIHHECEGGIEKSIPRIADWHHGVCQVMINGELEGQIFLSHPFTINGFFFLPTTTKVIFKLFVAFPWVETSTGPGGFMICVFII